MTAALSLEDVCVDVRGNSILSGVDLSVEPGEVRALVGLNGAGKTTALRVILAMLRPSSGRVTVLGERVAASGGAVWRRVGHLVETPPCYPELTARENIEGYAYLHDADMRRATRECVRLAEALGLAEWLDRPARRLSLGSRQKVGLISALVHDPDLVVLDEPTNALDPVAVVAFRTELEQMRQRGGAVLVTSHHFDEVARVAGQVEVLHRGSVIDTFSPDGSDLERRFFDIVLAADTAGHGSAR